MSLLMFHKRRLDIIHRQYECNARLNEISMKIHDLQQYASNISDGAISMADMASTPASMFNRTLMYMTYAHNGALMGANYNMQQIMMLPNVQAQMAQMQDPNQQAMYQQWIFKNLYAQEREKFSKQETKLLNEQEKELEHEKSKIETELKMLQAELEGVKQGEQEAIKDWKPEFVA